MGSGASAWSGQVKTRISLRLVLRYVCEVWVIKRHKSVKPEKKATWKKFSFRWSWTPLVLISCVLMLHLTRKWLLSVVVVNHAGVCVALVSSWDDWRLICRIFHVAFEVTDVDFYLLATTLKHRTRTNQKRPVIKGCVITLIHFRTLVVAHPHKYHFKDQTFVGVRAPLPHMFGFYWTLSEWGIKIE